MAEDRMVLLDALRKAAADGGAGFLREGVRVLAEAATGAEAAEPAGAPGSARSASPCPESATARARPARAGAPSGRCPRSSPEACALGVPTRRAGGLVRAPGIEGMSRSEVSRACAARDAGVAAFRGRPLGEHAFPYLWPGATRLKVREAGRVVSMAILVAVGVALTGERWVLGPGLSPDNDEGSAWPRFLRSLVARGLTGVRPAIGDDHPGLARATAAW